MHADASPPNLASHPNRLAPKQRSCFTKVLATLLDILETFAPVHDARDVVRRRDRDVLELLTCQPDTGDELDVDVEGRGVFAENRGEVVKVVRVASSYRLGPSDVRAGGVSRLELGAEGVEPRGARVGLGCRADRRAARRDEDAEDDANEPCAFLPGGSADTKEWSGGPPSSHASVVVSDLSLPPRGTTTRV